MAPAIFQVFAILIAVFAFAQAAFPRQMSRWQMRGPGGDARIEPGETRLLVMRVMGVIVGVLALIMAFGSPTMLF
ncbi:hypothetical protein [Halopiger goleimassiliensis]|uniref:hypothetical protein n=1 Tax=Halopiger goleimassiliensis TaxID=1293048 RepID=UPI000677F78D|nr:hypothetical protein [Halopiger goleimassiliensis]